MTATEISALVIDDDEVDYLSIKRMLKSARNLDVLISWEPEYRAGLSRLSEENFDVCLVDFRLGNSSGLSLVKEARENGVDIPLIVLTGYEDHEIDLNALSAGASDFLEKGKATSELLARSIRYSIQEAENLRRISASQEQFRLLSEELKNANDELSSFASAISHDLKQPLNGFSGFSKLYTFHVEEFFSLVQPHTSQLPQEIAEKLEELRTHQLPSIEKSIDASTTRMTKMIKLIAALAKVGERQYACEPVDVEAVVSMIVESHKFQFHDSNLEIEIGELPTIMSDWNAIEQVLSNLLGNAIKYLDPARPGKIRVGCLSFKSKKRFFVQDNGRGIAEGDLRRVFNPFERLSNVCDTQGDGMGLAIVQSVLRGVGGRAWCESMLGTGSTFFFEHSTEINS